MDVVFFPGSTHTWLSLMLIEAGTGAARSFGISGSPSFMLGDALFRGDDRLDVALDGAMKPALASKMPPV